MDKGDKTLKEFEKALSEQGEQVYVLRLFISGASPKSIEAIKNIKKICEEHLAGHYELQVVDVYQQPQLAADEQIVAAPMLVKRFPLPLRKLIGNLSNTSKVLQRLGLSA
ncbi:MAG TPA: circadian clock KaiB family protein [Blastocatellia bacterium]|nr:circadian clock KaiB family protein [Blastocatellia bacterium]